jgi:hexosaminidase
MDFRDEDMVADDKSVLQQVGGQKGNDGDVNDGSFSHADTRSTTPRLVMPGNFVDSPVTLKTHHIFLPTNTLGQKTARKLEKFTFRDPLVLPSNSSQKLPLEPLVEYRGVLLDAGRHYFPLPWIYNLIDYLHLLNMNLLHFRLTDDQAFNIRLDSRPELAQPAFESGGQIYSPNQLRQLVDYAKSKGIIIMPEINVPGHAGAWAGSIPRIVVPCAGFICRKGYGIPLNITHPDLIPIIRDVMEEIKDVFSTTPFFHLGGDVSI